MGKPEYATLFLCGDVMTGRGIDQILPHPSEPRLFEAYASSARTYVELAEKVNGVITQPVPYDYVWGDAMEEFAYFRPNARIINLETAITRSADAWPGKGIHYRMHPDNLACLTSAKIDCIVLANNHMLDWGRRGLTETVATLRGAGLRTAGAGANATAAAAPARLDLPQGGRVIVLSYATGDCGIPPGWGAGDAQPGLNLLESLSPRQADRIAWQVEAARSPGDIVVVSIHWGDNWGYTVPMEQRSFAHRLIDSCGVDLIHGHSSHHPKAIEVYRGKLVLYGCGDLINDYEGIGGHLEYRPALGLMYFPTVELQSGRLVRLVLTPTRMRRLRIERAGDMDADWLLSMLNREGSTLDNGFRRQDANHLALSTC